MENIFEVKKCQKVGRKTKINIQKSQFYICHKITNYNNVKFGLAFRAIELFCTIIIVIVTLFNYIFGFILYH